jgi:N-methylhydantoinase A
LKLPVIDVSEVGAGGGSIVRLDAGGAMKVGPESAGAVPGPACYGKGGTEPTVTDANVVLGYLNPDALAGGSVPIESERSRAALQSIATPLRMSMLEVAYGIYRLANSTMMRAVKAVSTYRGRDPRDFILFAFGGNGGIHAVALARELQIQRVIVPPAAGVFSAVGLLCADLEAARSAAFMRPLCADSVLESAHRCAQLEQQCLAEIGMCDGVTVSWRAELRYAGQGFELAVDLPHVAEVAAAQLSDADVSEIRARFEGEYRRTYGHELAGHNVDFVALRVIATVPPRGPQGLSRLRGAPLRAPTAPWRQAYFGREDGLIDTPVIERADLNLTPRPGPLIIEEYEGTTVVPPNASAFRDCFDNIVILTGEHSVGS